MIISRRSLITGLVSFVAAPAIVRASSLMPVKTLPVEIPVALLRDERGLIPAATTFTLDDLKRAIQILNNNELPDAQCYAYVPERGVIIPT